VKQRYTFIFILALFAVGGFGAAWELLKTKSPRAQVEHRHDHHGHGEEADQDDDESIEFTPQQLANAHLVVEPAGPATVATLISVYGKVAPNEEALVHVVPRFPGIVKAVNKRLGDAVYRGEILARIESNESLKSYDVVAEIDGTIIQKDVTLGELVKDDKTIFTVANLDSVWIDLNIFRRDFGALAVGSRVEFHTGEGHVAGEKHIQAKVNYISPFGSEGSQTMLARCVVPNKEGILRPGLYVDGEVVTGEVQAAVAVKNSALHQVDGRTVVFVQDGDRFKAREVQLGVKDNQRTQVTSGLVAGERYVSENSFIVKAEFGKGEAEHAH
jgi:cobalt-zinc-cadmium efflux system membrane fusion protein